LNETNILTSKLEQYFLSLGSNLGNRENNLNEALSEIDKFASRLSTSSIYETEPVGFLDQDYFLNLVTEISSPLEPEDLLIKLQAIEKKIGRVKNFKNGPRCIDIDILLSQDLQLKSRNLTIPHPRLDKRAFNLIPLLEISPEQIDPQSKKTFRSILENLKSKKEVSLWKKNNRPSRQRHPARSRRRSKSRGSKRYPGAHGQKF